MTVDTIDLDCSLCLSLEEWLRSSFAQETQRTVEEKILRFLFSTSPDDPQFQRNVEQLAWIGSNEKAKPLIAREIIELNTTIAGSPVLHCGFGKSLRKGASKIGRFIAKHKMEILAGVALSATGIGIAATLGYTLSVSLGSTAGGIAVYGAKSIFDSDDKHKPNKKIPNVPPPSSTVDMAVIGKPITSSWPKIDLPSVPNELLVTTEGIWADGQYYSTSDLMKDSLIAEELSKNRSTAPNYYSDSFNPLGNQNPFLLSPPHFLGDAMEVPELKELYLPTESIPNQTGIDGLQGISPDHWSDFDAPSKYAPNSRDPITGSPSYNDSRSRKFTLHGKESSGLQIGWINGVGNSFDESKDNGSYLQKLTGGYTVCGIYNCSHTAPVDVLEAGVLNYPGFSPNTSRLLQNDWKSFHEANLCRPHAKFLQVCHSQGAIHVRNALENLPEAIRDRVIVIAIAPAAVVPKRLCFKSFNYASEKDFIYKLEPSPASTTPLRIDSLMVPALGESAEERVELIILEAHSNDKGIDHEFQSPTYQPVLDRILAKYEEHRGEFKPEESETLK